MTIKNLSQLSRCEDLAIRKIEDTFYLVSVQGTYESNEIGATIVNAVGRDMAIEDLCQRLAEKYLDGDLMQIESDVNDYIAFLLTEGLLLNE
jgi:hypothetical protein